MLLGAGRLLRPFPSATPLHPLVYEKNERSEGSGDVAEEKEGSNPSSMSLLQLEEMSEE